MIPTDPVSDAIVEAQAAPDSFTTDESPTNELGERRFVHKLGWFGPVSLLLVISWTLITTASATLIALKFTATLSPSRANSAIGLVNVFGALTGRDLRDVRRVALRPHALAPGPAQPVADRRSDRVGHRCGRPLDG